MPKPLAQHVPCIHCTRGCKGEKSCAAGWRARTLATACWNGAWLPNKAPKRIQGVKVESVEAPTYSEAVKIAQDKGYPQWIWVQNEVPGESHNGVD